ncbi:MAG: pseudouridine synthase, partial [Vicinamibacterales bacterium]
LLEGVREYVYPVGRLDVDSEGLLILTNDGELTARLTHPRHGVERVYEARVRGVPDRRALDRLARGVAIEGRRTSPAKARLVRALDAQSGPQALVELTLCEGRKRQVRLMCDAIGHPVVRLRRIRIGPISDPRLKTGHWRELSDKEVASLKRAARV